MANIVILGSGMGGYGAAYRFHNEGIKPVMYDKNGYYGGHTASFPDSGYIFRSGSAHFFYQGHSHPGTVCRERGREVREHGAQPE